MEKKITTTRVIALGATALMCLSLFWLMGTRKINSSLESDLQTEKLKSESLLSEKLLLEKEIQKIKDQLFEMKGSNLQLDNGLKSALSKLASQESKYERMKRENRSVAQLKKERQELLALKNELENEQQRLRISYEESERKNRELNNALADLQERNKRLTEDLNHAMFASVEQPLVEARKGKNEKLTVKAKRTKKLLANFEVPANLKNLTYKIHNPDGILLTENDGVITAKASASEAEYTASTSSNAPGNSWQKIEMGFVPKQKLKAGIYTVEILNDNLHVGSLKVKLK